MSTDAQIKDSLKLGTALLREMEKIGHLHKQQVERAGFAVLRAPDIPSVLGAEIGRASCRERV